jgi:hypothetical protein
MTTIKSPYIADVISIIKTHTIDVGSTFTPRLIVFWIKKSILGMMCEVIK